MTIINNPINFNASIGFGARRKKNSSTEEKSSSFLKTPAFFSKKVSNALKIQRVYKAKIPEYGEIPQSIIKKCSTGEKGPIINKKTGEEVRVRAEITKPADKSYGQIKILRIYDGDKEIGHASYQEATKENPCLIPLKDYVGKNGAIYIDYMQNNFKGTYSHIGTLMHRLIHEISKQTGHNGKVILDSTSSAQRFHYDSGFIPSFSFNCDPDDEFSSTQAKYNEFMVAAGTRGGSCCMCLDEGKMDMLERGEHCIPDEIKNADKDTINKTESELRDKWHQTWE